MFPIIALSGSAYERGCTYGQAAAPLVRHSIGNYADLFAYRHGMDWAAVQHAALAYVPVLEEYAGEVLDEIRGLADGAGCQFAEIVALNARTELIAGAGRQLRHPEYEAATGRNRAAGIVDRGECTTVAALPSATAHHNTLLAQTWDWAGNQRAACVVLRLHRPGKPDALSVTEAGIMAKIGLNRAGVGTSLNILASLHDGQQPGMPVHVLLRQLLDVSSVDAAIALAKRTRAGASSCITVVDARGNAASLEITPGAVGVLPPQDGILAHTNHCVVESTRADQRPLEPVSSSMPRLDRATHMLNEQHGHITTDTLIGVLRDQSGGANAICREPDPALHPADRVESVLGVVIDVQAGVIHIAPDVPCKVDFTAVSL